jgi:hypoxanthine phosphoribosyltransferase
MAQSPGPQLDVVFPEAEIAKRVTELGASIRAEGGSQPLFLLGVLKGTSCFLPDLLRAIEGDVGYGFIDVVRDVADTEVATAMEIDFLNWIDISGKNVYLLKDVVSTGVIETYLLTQLRQKQPASLKLVALLDRPELRTVELESDFRAFQVSDGTFVGYGLELEGRFGNLRHIARVR